jgi:hypothetical protein
LGAAALHVSLGAASAALERSDLDRLTRSLRQSQSAPADAVAEELAARSLLGGNLQLLLSEAELDALIGALFRLRGVTERLQPLTELLALARAERRRRQS